MNKNIVALYIRVSTEEQARHGYSLPAQEEALTKYCEENNLIIAKKYIDDGVSGKLPIKKRPQLMQMLNDIPHMNVGRILLVKLDRFFRSVQEYYKAMEVLEKHNVTWTAILEDYNTETADGRLKVNIMLSVAQNEAERTSERIKFVFHSKAMRKEPISGSQPIGYKIERDTNGVKRVVKDPETEAMIDDMFSYMLRVKNAMQTANYLNGKYPDHFRARTTWSRTMQRPDYTGEYRGIPDYRPAYITPEQHQEIVAAVRGNIFRNFGRKTKEGKIYLFTGLIRCPECGHMLSSLCQHKLAPNRSHSFYNYYRCHRHVDRRCGYSKSISESRLEKALLMNIQHFAATQLHEIAAAPKKAPKPKIDKAKLGERLRRLTNAYIMGNLAEDEYAKMSAELRKQIAQPEEPEPKDETKVLREILEMNIEEQYSQLDTKGKREFWLSTVREIHLDKNKEPCRIIFA